MRVATRNQVHETGEGGGGAGAAAGGKLYYSISEVAELVSVKPHVLRYWETQFKMLRPRKNRAGNRSYRVKDVKMALRIRKLLYDEGFTIAGARRKLLDERRDGTGQTELDFVGISKEQFLKMMRRDLNELLLVMRGERTIESLAHRDEEDERGASTARSRREGLFADLGFADEETDGEDEADLDEEAAAPDADGGEGDGDDATDADDDAEDVDHDREPLAGEQKHRSLPKARAGDKSADAKEPVTEPPWGSA
jgi:DNA-binding transcriptional MerR regulator